MSRRLMWRSSEWTSEGSYVDRVAANLKIGHYVAEGVAPTMDGAMALVAFCFYGHMEVYPKLKIGFANAGASWVPLALEKAATRLALSATVRDVSLEPEHVWVDRRCSLAVFHAWESTVARLHDEFGKYAAFGSRYPFHDTATPQEALENFHKYGVPGDVSAKMMSGKAARFLGL